MSQSLKYYQREGGLHLMALTEGSSAVSGQPEMSGQLQLLRGPMAQLLSRVSMALAPAPVHVTRCIMQPIDLWQILPAAGRECAKGMFDSGMKLD